jgi:hypothetical protein
MKSGDTPIAQISLAFYDLFRLWPSSSQSATGDFQVKTPQNAASED